MSSQSTRNLTLTSSSSERNAQASPLLHLPAEIRIMIWQNVLDVDILVTREKSLAYNIKRRSKLCLLRVCKQIYDETLELAYFLATFYFPTLRHYRYAATTGKLSRIRRIHLTLTHTDIQAKTAMESKIPRDNLPSTHYLHIVITYPHTQSMGLCWRTFELDLVDHLHENQPTFEHVLWWNTSRQGSLNRD